MCLCGESGKLEADTVSDTSANGGGDGWGKHIKEGKDGCGSECEEEHFFHLKGLGGEEVCHNGNHQTFNKVFHNAG